MQYVLFIEEKTVSLQRKHCKTTKKGADENYNSKSTKGT